MSATQQDYYLYLTRTDHPAFAKVLTDTVDETTPLNSIMNRVVANQLVALKAKLDDLRANCLASTATMTFIDAWEQRYFGYTSPNLDLADRIARVLTRKNKQLTMGVATVISLAESITGQTPRVVRSLLKGGWELGTSVLGLDTMMAGNETEIDSQTYLVIFDSPISSASQDQLEEQLNIVQKGGSINYVLAVSPQWILGESALGVDTVVG